ncbi:MAG TPA: hypothetical protein DDZ83_19440 [Nitrospinae bacterium]|nr:hypothetical protein [Nitrospinota bacterium]
MHGRGQNIRARIQLEGYIIRVNYLFSAWRPSHEKKIVPEKEKPTARRGEKRPVLSPLNYRDSVRRAYQAARETPSLFDKLFCYCYCDRSFGHKSLLSCYATTHAAG